MNGQMGMQQGNNMGGWGNNGMQNMTVNPEMQRMNGGGMQMQQQGNMGGGMGGGMMNNNNNNMNMNQNSQIGQGGWNGMSGGQLASQFNGGNNWYTQQQQQQNQGGQQGGWQQCGCGCDSSQLGLYDGQLTCMGCGWNGRGYSW